MRRWRSIRPACTALAIAAAIGVPPARAQMESREGIALQNQILELRHELEQLREQGGGGQGYAPPAYPSAPAEGGPQGDISAQLLDRVSRLEEDVRSLRGRIDEIDNARQQAEADLAKQIGDLNFKLTGNAGAAPAAPASPAPPPPPGQTLSPPPGFLGAPATPAPELAPVRRTPEVALSAGYSALAKHDYPAAEAAAREVLAAGRGPRAADAQYLLAQAKMSERNYDAAAVAYDDAYKRNPRGPRAPDSLLGLANALAVLGDKAAACETLTKLHTEFPSPPASLRPAIIAAHGRAACR